MACKYPGSSTVGGPDDPRGTLKPMAILVDKDTKAIVCGITGREGSFHTKQMIEYGTQIVGGVTPGKGGQSFEGVPIFDTVDDAVKQTGADAAVIFVPPAFAADSVLECEAAGIPFVSLITEGIPIQDSLKVLGHLKMRHR